MTPAPSFRRAQPADAPQLLRLYGELGDASAPAQERIDRFFERLSAYPDYGIWLLELADELDPVGCYSLLVMDNLAHGAAPVGVVESVVVTARYRKHGLGRCLMDDAARRAAAAGCYKVMLSSNLHREQAHGFYAALGYVLHGYSLALPLGQAV
jgi:GNAT superfamily N-acetyltransferase